MTEGPQDPQARKRIIEAAVLPGVIRSGMEENRRIMKDALIALERALESNSRQNPQTALGLAAQLQVDSIFDDSKRAIEELRDSTNVAAERELASAADVLAAGGNYRPITESTGGDQTPDDSSRNSPSPASE